jgi:hypothetical protein
MTKKPIKWQKMRENAPKWSKTAINVQKELHYSTMRVGGGREVWRF